MLGSDSETTRPQECPEKHLVFLGPRKSMIFLGDDNGEASCERSELHNVHKPFDVS